jgi:hypothetical protein
VPADVSLEDLELVGAFDAGPLGAALQTRRKLR